MIPLALLACLIGYLLGSLPPGYLAGRWLAGVDLRREGSGSTGATNVLRVVGRRAALAVFLIDVGKGAAAVLLARWLLEGAGPVADGLEWWITLAGLMALVGHIWPVWLGGRGGKAVATGFGVLLGISWPVALACLGCFLLCLAISRIVSLSSVVAAVCLPLLMAAQGFSSGRQSPAHLTLALLAMAVVLWRHRGNLHRLLRGEEPRLGSQAGGGR